MGTSEFFEYAQSIDLNEIDFESIIAKSEEYADKITNINFSKERSVFGSNKLLQDEAKSSFVPTQLVLSGVMLASALVLPYFDLI